MDNWSAKIKKLPIGKEPKKRNKTNRLNIGFTQKKKLSSVSKIECINKVDILTNPHLKGQLEVSQWHKQYINLLKCHHINIKSINTKHLFDHKWQ